MQLTWGLVNPSTHEYITNSASFNFHGVQSPWEIALIIMQELLFAYNLSNFLLTSRGTACCLTRLEIEIFKLQTSNEAQLQLTSN